MFKEYARVYDICNSDKDYAAEALYIAGLIRSHRPHATSVLELGSGTGTHAELLAKMGYDVMGVEMSREMVAQAASKHLHPDLTLEFVLGDMRNFESSRRFDVCLSLFHVISYQVTEKDVLDAFHTARKHLTQDGLFAFDVWYGPAVLSERPQVRIKRISRDGLSVVRIAEPQHNINENVVDVNYTLQVKEVDSIGILEIEETHRMRYYFLPELRSLLERSGFRIVDAHGWLDQAKLSDKTWGACFVAEAV